MKRNIKIGYENRQGSAGDLLPTPKLILANHFLNKLSNLSIGDFVSVEYSPDQIIIRKLINLKP